MTGITYMLHLYTYSCGLYVSGNRGWKSTHVKSDKSTKVETTGDITVNNHLAWNVCKIFSVLILEPNHSRIMSARYNYLTYSQALTKRGSL